MQRTIANTLRAAMRLQMNVLDVANAPRTMSSSNRMATVTQMRDDLARVRSFVDMVAAGNAEEPEAGQ